MPQYLAKVVIRNHAVSILLAGIRNIKMHMPGNAVAMQIAGLLKAEWTPNTGEGQPTRTSDGATMAQSGAILGSFVQDS